MDMGSLSRDDVRRILGFSEETLDALIAGGHLLCHVTDGEMRIPISQLESFFRDGLLCVYRAEAATVDAIVTSFDDAIPAPPPEELRPAPPPVAQVVDEDEEIGEITVTDIRQEEEEDDERRPSTTDLRTTPRFIPRRQIGGIIDDIKFTIVQLSRTGLRIRHYEELLPAGDTSKLTFALLNPPRSFVMRGRVVWTSAATTDSGERKFFISGVRITDHVDRLINAIDILNRTHDLQPDRRSTSRHIPGDEDVLPVAAATDDEIALVIKAIQHFASDPVDANKWYARARFALSDANVRRHAPRKGRDREEVLGIWEYLDRQIEIGKVEDIVGWARRSRSALAIRAPL